MLLEVVGFDLGTAALTFDGCVVDGVGRVDGLLNLAQRVLHCEFYSIIGSAESI